jgi:hypothetical protein
MQEVWTICRIFRRSLTYKKQPPVIVAAVAAQPDSSSNTGSLEWDTGDEYMNGLPPQATTTMNNDVSDAYSSYQFHGQWNSGVVPPPASVAETQPSPAMANAFYHDVHSSQLAAPSDEYYKDDGCSWDGIDRMVMELTDPSVFYDCTFA